MLTKEKLIASIRAMPEEEFADMDILFERLVILEKIDKGENDIMEGRIYTTSEAKKKLDKWLK